MRVQKFRTVEQMAAATILVPSGEGFDRFLRHCARFWALVRRTMPAMDDARRWLDVYGLELHRYGLMDDAERDAA